MLAHFLLKYIVAYQFVQLRIALFVIYHNLPFAIFIIDYFEGKIYIIRQYQNGEYSKYLFILCFKQQHAAYQENE